MAWYRILLPMVAGLLACPLAAQTVPGPVSPAPIPAPISAPISASAMAAPVLTDPELAQLTGKFFLPGGVEVALTVTSDTVLNGQPLLRTVLAVDHGSTLSVYGRTGDPASGVSGSVERSTGATPAAPTGIAVAFDRHSGIQTITPTYAGAGQPNVSLGATAPDAVAAGLERLAVTPDGPAVRTADGLVSVRSLANGSLVNLAGDQLAASHLVGQSIATVLANSGNDRTFDTVTNVAVDLRNITPYQVGAAAIQASSLALEATRSMIR